MTSHSPHRRWKGCPICKDHKDDRHGDAVRMPWPVLKKMGRRRRVARRYVPDE
ncbi:hypothetical protein [Actinomadura violacea]|uniref:Uncharacterized protein n=1 Tax=Actinomadura violacea TaxID=2819934 RepID=A0ABS3RXR8_9ACTN|nr:hypothetical protein [Actinomadura violacea]MBO2461561.1 hypothetical protein [Actinomadura violacea]